MTATQRAEMTLTNFKLWCVELGSRQQVVAGKMLWKAQCMEWSLRTPAEGLAGPKAPERWQGDPCLDHPSPSKSSEPITVGTPGSTMPGVRRFIPDPSGEGRRASSLRCSQTPGASADYWRHFPRGGAAVSPKKKPPRNPRGLSKAEAEKRKLALMRHSDTDTTSHYNIGGREKPTARKPSLPSKESLRKLDDDGED